MSNDPDNGSGPTDDLSRAELIRLVAELRATIARQAAAIAALQARGAAPRQERSGVSTPPIGSAADAQPVPRPTAKPVPGFDYTVVFDGGAIGNPGFGYGSYQIVDADGGVVAERQLDFGDQVTNNQAEYRTLIHALEDLRERLGPAAATARVAVRGDSQLVVLTVTGRWKAREATLRLLCHRAVELLSGFGQTDVAWQRRDASVRVLGH